MQQKLRKVKTSYHTWPIWAEWLGGSQRTLKERISRQRLSRSLKREDNPAKTRLGVRAQRGGQAQQELGASREPLQREKDNEVNEK